MKFIRKILFVSPKMEFELSVPYFLFKPFLHLLETKQIRYNFSETPRKFRGKELNK